MSVGSDHIALTKDVLDVDGSLIMKAGTEMTDENLKKVAAGHAHKKLRYIQGTFLAEDVRIIIRERNCRDMFSDKARKEKIIDVFDHIGLTSPLRHEMELMKKRSIHLYHHSIATTIMALGMVAGKMVEDKDLDKIGVAMLLHDLGMTRIDQKLLQNTDHLSSQEFAEIQSHAAIGSVLINYYMGDGIGVTVAYRHHENRGHGYPKDGGKPSKIVELSTVVDIFNALISHRPFRMFSYDVRGAIDVLIEMSEANKVEKAFVKLLAAAYRHTDESLDKLELSEEKMGFTPEKNYYGLSYGDRK
jgi:HD-GYP domain-containing protein (c-di-GMP phosphodiesterase class II)